MKLPPNPWLFVLAYFTSAVASILAQTAYFSFSAYLAFLFIVAAFLFHIVWTVAALDFISVANAREKGKVREGYADLAYKGRLAAGYGIALTVGVFVVNFALKSVFGTEQSQALAIPQALLSILAIFFLARFFWIAGYALSQAEIGENPPFYAKLGAFLMFVYLFVGAPFIFYRLKAIAARAAFSES
jgi:hypothetical protein